MEEQENKLGTAPIGKLLVQMSLPAITAQVINALYNIVASFSEPSSPRRKPRQ